MLTFTIINLGVPCALKSILCSVVKKLCFHMMAAINLDDVCLFFYFILFAFSSTLPFQNAYFFVILRAHSGIINVYLLEESTKNSFVVKTEILSGSPLIFTSQLPAFLTVPHALSGSFSSPSYPSRSYVTTSYEKFQT